MSVKVDNSLGVAHKLKADGFASLLEAQPEVEREFIVLWQKSFSLRECRRQLITRYPTSQIPSVNALSTYVKKNLKHSTIDSRSPEYVKAAARFNSVRQLYRIGGEAERRYKYAVATDASWLTQSRLFLNMLNATEKVLNMEIKLGLRQVIPEEDMPMPGEETVTETTSTVSQEETIARAVDVAESYERFKAQLDDVIANGTSAKAY